MFMLCLVGMCHAPAPSHNRLLPREKSCLALFPNPTTPTLRNPTSHSRHTFHPHPTRFPSLSLCSFHPFVVSTLALSNSSHLTSMACVLKRFPFASPRKLSLTCVKWGFLRTPGPHRTSQLSPCAPLMSQCHVHAVPGRDVPCPCTTAPSASPARELLSCPETVPCDGIQ